MIPVHIPGCLTSHRGFAVWADAALWSAGCGGHPYIRLEDGQWMVHYVFVLVVMDGDV